LAVRALDHLADEAARSVGEVGGRAQGHCGYVLGGGGLVLEPDRDGQGFGVGAEVLEGEAAERDVLDRAFLASRKRQRACMEGG
jgi:hypothetical protein